jgi:hypothetical protein
VKREKSWIWRKYLKAAAKAKGPPISREPFRVLLQEQLLEQKDPYKVKPADEHTAKGDDDADHKSEQTALLGPGRPSDDDLGDPVDHGNDEQKELHQTALFVKPSHNMYLQKDLYFYFIIQKHFLSIPKNKC